MRLALLIALGTAFGIAFGVALIPVAASIVAAALAATSKAAPQLRRVSEEVWAPATMRRVRIAGLWLIVLVLFIAWVASDRHGQPSP